MLVNCRFVPESLRWLMLNGRYPEAEKHVKRICWKNGLSFPIETFESVKRDVTEHIQEEQTKGKYTIMDLVRTPIMRKRSIASFYIWYAMSQTRKHFTPLDEHINMTLLRRLCLY